MNKKVPHGKILYLITDGAARRNPGPGAFAVILRDEDNETYYQHAEYLGRTTNNVAELAALKHGLEKAMEFTRGKIIHYTDSNNVVQWCSGNWCARKEHIKILVGEIQELKVKWNYDIEHRHVPRENHLVSECDRLANQVLDKELGKK